MSLSGRRPYITQGNQRPTLASSQATTQAKTQHTHIHTHTKITDEKHTYNVHTHKKHVLTSQNSALVTPPPLPPLAPTNNVNASWGRASASSGSPSRRERPFCRLPSAFRLSSRPKLSRGSLSLAYLRRKGGGGSKGVVRRAGWQKNRPLLGVQRCVAAFLVS